MARIKNWNKLFIECWTRMYAESTPPADFKVYLQKAKNAYKQGEKYEIPMKSHFLDQERFDEIIKEVLDEHEVTNDYYRRKFSAEIYIGCSPEISNRKV